jgi:hypothetical protein
MVRNKESWNPVRISSLSQNALSVCASVAILAGCSSGGSQLAPSSSVSARSVDSALNLLPESRGSIVYTPSNSSCSVELGNSCSFNIDVNNDGSSDFTINVAYGESHCAPHCVYYAIATVQPALGNGVIANTYGWASPLATETKIGSREPFYYAGALMADVGEYILHGYWLNVGPHFLGLAFMVSGKTYYGWARLSVKAPRGVHGQGAITTKLTGYAYETKSGESIKAGQK